MSRRKGIFGYAIIASITFIVFVISISKKGDNLYSINNNLQNVKDIFSIDALQVTHAKPHLEINVLDDGYDIYVPKKIGYRYGPSIIYYEDGTMDAWFASNGNNKEWDWIRYRHFDGDVWQSEEIVLRPTSNGLDHYSTCDPGVIYFNGYYYLAYSSTSNATNGGVENCIYVARSENPNGPFEKWDGEKWGGKPSPIISYDNNDGYWGVGEVSFVINNEKLYCYYTLICAEGSFTKLAISNLEDDWPLQLSDEGIVIVKENGQDSCDVVYDDVHNKFLAFCVESRFLENSSIAVFESEDGVEFEKSLNIEDGIHEYAHNMGISKMCNGHINKEEDLVIGYAYSSSPIDTWGKWSTKFQPIEIKIKYE